MITKFNKYLLLERSTLTNLGVPTEVMKPIQRDYSLSNNVEWVKIEKKKDVIEILKNSNKSFILQITLDSIMVFVSIDGEYFIDKYILDDDDDWGGGYIPKGREYTSITQISYHIENGSLIYELKGEFTVNTQEERKEVKKTKEFNDFTLKFKKDFLKQFDAILKKIVGSKYRSANKEIQQKAKLVELENNMLMRGLDDPLKGANGLTILDEFILQFEDGYSEYFGERIDLLELSEYFSRDKLMTLFMYFIYTGEIPNM